MAETREARTLSGADVGREIRMEGEWLTLAGIIQRRHATHIDVEIPGSTMWMHALEPDDLVTVRDVGA